MFVTDNSCKNLAVLISNYTTQCAISQKRVYIPWQRRRPSLQSFHEDAINCLWLWPSLNKTDTLVSLNLGRTSVVKHCDPRLNTLLELYNKQLRAPIDSDPDATRYSPDREDRGACSLQLHSVDEQAKTTFITTWVASCQNRSTTASTMVTRSFFNSKALLSTVSNLHECCAIHSAGS